MPRSIRARSQGCLVIALLAGLSLGLVSGCDDGSPGGGGQDWCDQSDGPYNGIRALYAAMCGAMQRCELGPELGYAFQCRQECVQVFAFGLGCGISEGSDRDRWNRQVFERQVIYDEEQGGACAEWLASADCAVIAGIFAGGGLGGEDTPGQPAACQAAFEVVDPDDPPPPGSVAEGEACQDASDCQQGLTCQAPADGQTCAVCAPLPGAGQPCLEYQCGLGNTCDWNQAPPTCVAQLADGSACTGHEQCLSLRCVAGFCMTPRADGQTCAQHAECESQLCHLGSCTSYREEGEICDADEVCSTGRCYQGACIRVRQIGEACEDDPQCWEICFRGVCDETHAAGDPCDVVDDCYDPPTMVCYQGVCVPLHQLPEGAPCTLDEDCATNRCLDGACFTMLDNGAACTRPEECAQVVCDQGFCGLADGATCWGHEMCSSMRCLNYTSCITPQADGEACTSQDECAPGSAWRASASPSASRAPPAPARPSAKTTCTATRARPRASPSAGPARPAPATRRASTGTAIRSRRSADTRPATPAATTGTARATATARCARTGARTARTAPATRSACTTA